MESICGTICAVSAGTLIANMLQPQLPQLQIQHRRTRLVDPLLVYNLVPQQPLPQYLPTVLFRVLSAQQRFTRHDKHMQVRMPPQ